MPQPPKLPVSDEPIIALISQGWNYRQVGDIFGVQRETVRLRCEKIGIKAQSAKNRAKHRDVLPWKGYSGFANHLPLVRLRAYIRSRRMGIRDSESGEKFLDEWIEWMNGGNPTRAPLVVDFNPLTGFSYVPAEPGDEHFIRIPK